MKITLDLKNIDKILNLRKSEQLLFFKLIELIESNDDIGNAIIILDTEERARIANELNLLVTSLNATLSRLIKKGLMIRRTNSVYTIDKDLLTIEH